MSAPANQTCATAITIGSLPYNTTVDTTGAGSSPANPDSGCGTGNSYNSVWYKWTCPGGVASIVTGLASAVPFANLVTVFSGASCAALTDLAICTYDGYLPATIPTTPGTTYFFLLTSFAPGGSPALTFFVLPITTDGDTCASGNTIPSLPYRVALDTTGNGDSPGNPDGGCGSGNSYNSAWLTWTCPPGLSTAVLTLDDGGSGEAVFTMFSGDCGSLVDEGFCCGQTTQNALIVIPGTTYRFMLTTVNPGGLAALTFILESTTPTGSFCIDLSCGGPPPPPPPPGPAATLILDTVAKRWMYDKSDKTEIWTRLEEPGVGVYDQMVGGRDGVLYQYDLDAIQDDDTDIPWDVWTPWPDAGAPRLEKQWGDIAVGLDAAGSVAGITATPVAQDGAVGETAVVLGQNESGRQSYIVDMVSGGGVIARNLGVRFSGAMQSADTARPRLFWWEPSYLPKGPSIARRATDWDTLGYTGAKFIQGVIIRANTFGVDKTVNVQRDGGQIALTLTLNHAGEVQKAYPLASGGWTPFVSELVRLEGIDDRDWLLLDYRFVWEPAPELATQWETQFTSAEWPGFGTVRDMVFAYEATADFTLVYTADDVQQSYTIPANGGAYSRFYFPFQPNKGKAIKFQWKTAEPGRIYKRDCSVRTQGWGEPGGYRIQSVFGGPSRTSGAEI